MSHPYNRLRFTIAILSTALAAACGSVVVTPGPEGGSGGTSTSTSGTTTSSAGTAGAGGAVSPMCSIDADCPFVDVCAKPICLLGACSVASLPHGAPCPEGVCDGMGHCVECVTYLDCAPGQLCYDNVCAAPDPSCTDGVLNGDEMNVDCGGSCPPCPCAQHLDCLSGFCLGGKCYEAVLINELRTSGPMGDVFGDEILELRNPGDVDLVFDEGWTIWHRSAQGGCQGKVLRYQGKGQVIPALGRMLLVGPSYAQAVPPDDVLENVSAVASIADAGTVWIEHDGMVIDTLCYFDDTTTLGTLLGSCAEPYECFGPPADNYPHDGTVNGGVNASLTRKEDVGGRPINTLNNAVDFAMVSPSTPQGL